MISLFRKPRLSRPAAGPRGRQPRRAEPFRPGLEALEDRLIPSAIPPNYFYWTGAAGDGNWGNVANWLSQTPGGPASTPGAVAVFDYGIAQQVNGAYQTHVTNDVPGGTTLLTLVIQGTARVGEGSFRIDGNALGVQGGVSDTASNSIDLVQAPILLLGNLPVSVSASENLVLGGPITEGRAGLGITKRGGGSLFLTAGNTASGTTTVAAGSLYLEGSSGVRQVTDRLVINSGATVYDNSDGQLGSARVTVNGGGSLVLPAGVSDTIASLSGGGAVRVGAGSVLTIQATKSATFAGSIGGTGGMVFDGSLGTFTWTLGGASPDFGGDLRAEGGATLAVTNGAALGRASVSVASGSALELVGGITVSSPARLILNPGSRLEGVGAGTVNEWAAPVSLLTLSGGTTLKGFADIQADFASPLVLSGAVSDDPENPAGSAAGLRTDGEVILSGANSYTGGTKVASGVLTVAASTALGAGGAVRVGPGTELDLYGDISYAAPTLRLGGTLRLGDFSSTWNGPITLTGDASVIAGSAATLTLAGTVTGAHTMTVTGGGSVILTGHDRAANTTVQGATLVVNGQAGAVTVGNLAFLAGRGTTGAVTVSAGGTLEPGSAATHDGALTTGAVTFAQGSTFKVGFGTSKLIALGNVHLNGADLEVIPPRDGTKPLEGATIIETQSSVFNFFSITGTFASVPPEYQVSYGDSSVSVKAVL
jgi:fibronectin-binding autotransporter adhesin